MGTKNALCPYCQPYRSDMRVFPVSAEASVAYCPFCMKEISPKKAIDLYNSVINNMLEKADNTLFVACDPALAYQQYADVLEIEKYNSRALLGRILCLIYTSKVRNSYLVEAKTLLENISHKGIDEVNNYVVFLKKISFALDEYNAALLKKLSNHRNFFYDEECLKLYLKHLLEILKFKKDILDNLKEIREDYLSQRNDKLLNLVNHDIEAKEGLLRTVHFLVNGKGYKVTKIVGEKIYVDTTGDFTDVRTNRRQYSLTQEKGKRVIKDLAFEDFTPIIRAKNASIFIIIFSLLAAGGCGACIYFFKDTPLYFYLSIAGAGFFGLLAITFIALHFMWKSFLKKRKLRIA